LGVWRKHKQRNQPPKTLSKERLKNGQFDAKWVE
jgi:hypothetical protein